MKQVRLFLGGHKFHNQDYQYMQDGNLSTHNAVVDGLTNGEILTILSGAVFTLQGGTSYTWTEGIIKYIDNFYFLPAEGSSTDLAANSFNLVEVAEPLGPTIYRDGTSRDVHVDTQLELISGVGGTIAGLTLIVKNKLIVDVMTNLVDQSGLGAYLVDQGFRDQFYADSVWSDLTIGSNWTEQENCAVTLQGTQVEIRGRLQGSAAAALVALSGIPVALRPSSDRTMAVDIIDTSAGKILTRGHMTVKTTGNIEFNFADYSTEGIVGDDVLLLNGCKYSI